MLFTFCLFCFYSCMKAPKDAKSCDVINNTNDFFTIQSNDDSPGRAYNVFCKKVNVFGIYVYGKCKVEDNDLLIAANILAHYLDNDEDGIIDNPLVLDKMIENKAAMVMFGKEGLHLKIDFLEQILENIARSQHKIYMEKKHIQIGITTLHLMQHLKRFTW